MNENKNDSWDWEVDKKKESLEVTLISEVKNTDKTLFGRLRRLFSTNVIVRNVGGKKVKGKDTEQIQS